MDLGLTDRGAVVTGGSRGIGLATARALGAEGARVLLVGRGEAALRTAAGELGDRASWLALDITEPDAGERVLAAATERLGTLDVLVNNAGGTDAHAIEELSDAEYAAQFEVHVMAPLRLMRAAIGPMADRGWGRIVNVASSAGRRPGTLSLAYAVSKAAELSLSRGYAEAYASRGVLVNAVNPGAIAGASWHADGGLGDQVAARTGQTREQVLAGMAAGLPRGALGTDEEIADLIVYLCSDRNRNTVGAAVSADGGAVPSIF